MLFLTLLVALFASFAKGQDLPEADMIIRLQTYDEQTKTYCKQQATANWDVQTDVGNEAKEEAQVSENE